MRSSTLCIGFKYVSLYLCFPKYVHMWLKKLPIIKHIKESKGKMRERYIKYNKVRLRTCNFEIVVQFKTEYISTCLYRGIQKWKNLFSWNIFKWSQGNICLLNRCDLFNIPPSPYYHWRRMIQYIGSPSGI